jgi:hypothetical protein
VVGDDTAFADVKGGIFFLVFKCVVVAVSVSVSYHEPALSLSASPSPTPEHEESLSLASGMSSSSSSGFNIDLRLSSDYDGGSSTSDKIVSWFLNSWDQCISLRPPQTSTSRTSATLRRRSIQPASVLHQNIMTMLGLSPESGTLRTHSA